MKFFALAVALAAIATPVPAQDRLPITLVPEDMVTLWLDESGATLTRLEASHAPWRPFDLAVARHLSGLPPPKEPAPAVPLASGGAIPPAPPVLAHRLGLRFMSIAGQHSILIVENGFDRAVTFRARMTRGANTVATDVCLVVPMRYGFEHWPHPIDRIEISDIRFVPWHEGDPVPCA